MWNRPPARVQVLATGLGFTEGPVLLTRGGVVVVSVDLGFVTWLDDHGNVIRQVEVGGGPNGAAEDAAGNVLIAQAGSASPISHGSPMPGGIQSIDGDGAIRWVAHDPVSPNDLCVGPDGFVYCTDPTRPLAASDGRLWRCDPVSGESQLLAVTDWYPNGIGFGEHDDQLFVADTTNRRILRYPLDGGACGEPELVVELERGHPDGFAFDAEGNLVVAAVQFDPSRRGEIQTYSPAGTLEHVVTPGDGRLYTNVAIGGTGELIITASGEGQVLRTRHAVAGMPLHPFR